MTRTAASILFAASALLLASRLVSPAASSPEPRSAPVQVSDQTPPALAEVNREVDRLRDRLAPVPESPAPARDPFSFGRATERRRALAAPVDVAPPPVATPPPVLPKLVAILSSTTDSGAPSRTAVIALGDDVQFKKAGDEIGAFVVESVSPDTLVIVDSASNTRHGIPLH